MALPALDRLGAARATEMMLAMTPAAERKPSEPVLGYGLDIGCHPLDRPPVRESILIGPDSSEVTTPGCGSTG